ncbi:MAG: PAS domain S-box protein [Smithella sp.]
MKNGNTAKTVKNKKPASRKSLPVKKIIKKGTVLPVLKKMASGRKLTVKSLNREDALRYRSMIENITDGYFETDLAGNLTFFNDSVCRTLGYSRRELMQKNNRFYMDEENAKKVFQAYKKVNKTGKPLNHFGYYVTKKNGCPIYVEGSISLRKNSIGKPIGFMVIINDFTQRKQMEEALKKSEKYFKAVTENSSDILIIVDRKGDIKYCSRSVELFTGYKPEELIGKSAFSFIHPDDLQRAIDDYTRAILTTETAPIPNAFRVMHKNGSEVYLDGLGKNLLDNPDIAGFVMNVRDITERRRAEESLRKSENRLRAQYNGNPIPTFTWQKQGKDFILTDFNNSAKNFTNGQSKAFLGRRASEMYKNRPEILQNFWKCFDEKQIVTIETISEHFKPGKIVVITFVFISPDLIMVHMEDITERKQAEEKLIKSQESYRKLFEDHVAIKLIIDPDTGMILDANLAAAQYYGWTRDEMKRMKIWQINTLPPELIKEEMKKTLMQKRFHFEFQHCRADGSVRDVEVFSSKIEMNGKDVLHSIVHDITERKQTEESLKQAELKFRTIFDFASDGIILVCKKDRKFLLANKTMCEMLGYSQEEIMKLGVADIHRPESLPYVAEQFERLSDNEITVSRDIPVLKKDKTVFFADISASSITLNGKDCLIGMFRDITERKRAEQALRESEEKYKLLADQSIMGMFIIQEGCIKYANYATSKIIGYSIEEMLNWEKDEYSVVLHPDDLPTVMEQVRRKQTGYPDIVVNYSWKIITKSGEIKWVESFSKTISFEGSPADFVMMIDITERKKAEEALQKSEDKYRTFFKTSRDCVFITSLDGDWVDMNDSAVELFGYSSKEELLQIKIPDLYIKPEERTKHINTILERGYSKDYPIDLLRKDGSIMHALITATVRRDDKGNAIGFMGTIKDITERNKAEEELKKYHEHLEELVRERTTKLEASNMELESFSYSASHDLRAPLRTIDGFCHALLEDCGDTLNTQGKDYLKRIMTAAGRMTLLIEDLLKLSRITRMEMNIGTINMSNIARSIINELQSTHPRRHVRVTIADNLKDDADSRLIRIAFENLLGNAWKFTEKKKDAVIEFGVEKKDGRNIYFVRDNGAGFDMAYAEKLFAPFQRLHTEVEFPGTGIGLANVRRVIHRHGGTVWAEGKPDHGATFYFTLHEL